MLKILLIGYGEIGSALLKGILKTRHQIVGVLSWNRRKYSNRIANSIWPDNIEKIRKANNIVNIDLTSVNGFEFSKIVMELKPDILLIGSWGEILKKHVIEMPLKACINCHPSFLPYNRGSNPYSSAIMNNYNYSGVTFHLVDEGIDTGNILLQKKIYIDETETGGSLRKKCAILAESLVIELLNDIESKLTNQLVQDESLASYYPRLKAEDGSINWNDDPVRIYNKIRGLNPWIPSYTTYRNKLILIKNVVLKNVSIENTESGKIIQVMDSGVLVATIDPTKALLFDSMKIHGLNDFFSHYYLKNIFQPGSFFKNAL